jgi:hypothetical protein
MHSLIARLDEGKELTVRIGQYDRPITATNLRRLDLCAVLSEPVVPVVMASGGNRQRDLDAQSDAQPARRRMTEREEREISSRVAVGVGVEEMVRVRRVLVDALLDQTHPEQPSIELEILLRVAADRRDVVNAGDV